MAIADFESGIRDLVSNVENAYWDLYFAYRDLDAKVAARNSALDSWRRVQASIKLVAKGAKLKRKLKHASNISASKKKCKNALSGRLVDGTQTNNGSSGGSFRPNGGVQVAERRLRLILGLPITDGRMLRPADQPSLATHSIRLANDPRRSLATSQRIAQATLVDQNVVSWNIWLEKLAAAKSRHDGSLSLARVWQRSAEL